MTIRTFVEQSSLSRADKDFWFSVLEGLDDAQIKIFEDFVDGNEENLKELTDNLKAKRKAFEELDEKALEEIITKEY